MQFAVTVPTVEDRVVQAAVLQLLEPIFEAEFYPVSYGFRPKRSVRDAVEHLRLAIKPPKEKLNCAWLLQPVGSCQHGYAAADFWRARTGALSLAIHPWMATSRFGHFLTVLMRDKLGSFMAREQCESFLNNWISQYVLLDDFASQQAKAQFPLRAARVG